MLIAIDTHVHLYPAYQLDQAISCAWRNLDAIVAQGATSGAVHGEAPVKVLCLTERRECSFFRGFCTGSVEIPGGGCTVHVHGEDAVIISREGGEDLLLVLPGRQIVTRERLEVLALTVDVDIPDGLPLVEVVSRVQGAGAIPVLNWAPGKWLFGRGRVIARAISTASPEELLIGDTTLRPEGWGEPRLMKRARLRGFRTIAGSDPLPCAGEESNIGRYGVLVEADFNWREPAGSIRRALRSSPLSVAGKRGSFSEVWRRLRANQAVRRQGRAVASEATGVAQVAAE